MKRQKTPAGRQTEQGENWLMSTSIISHIGLLVKPRKENIMNEIGDHPTIHEIETTGYPASKGETVLKCPCCGEELSINDFVYTGYNGKIVGCEHCLTSHFAENMEEVYND